MVTVFHYTPVNAKQFDGLNIDGQAGKHQNVKISPRQNFALYDIRILLYNLIIIIICNEFIAN